MLVLANLIKKAYEHNGFISALVIGNLGSGKTSYALHVASEIYGWGNAPKHLFFDLDPALQLLENALHQHRRIPLLILDDAGLWLSRLRWWEEDITRFMELYNIMRTLASGIIFTSPTNDLPRAILRKIIFRITLKPISIDEARNRLNLNDNIKWRDYKGLLKLRGQNPDYWNVATGYRLHTLPSFMQFVRKHFEDCYPLHYPKSVYEEYEKIRSVAVEKALKRLKESRSKKNPIMEKVESE